MAGRHWLGAHEGYGQSETVILVGNFRSLNRPVLPGSMGQPTPGLSSRADGRSATGSSTPATEGEVAIRIKPHRPLGLFQEYWLSPAEQARQFRGDWY